MPKGKRLDDQTKVLYIIKQKVALSVQGGSGAYRVGYEFTGNLMTKSLRRIGGAVGMGVAWALVWAPIAVLIGTTIIDPDNSMDEMWPAIGAYPAFLCALVFSAIVALAERSRRLNEVPLVRAGAWGAVAGVVVGVFPFFIGEPTSRLPLWEFALAVMGSIALMSGVSAVASALWSRHAARKQELGRPARAG